MVFGRYMLIATIPLICAATLAAAPPEPSVSLGMNDISFLWPAPATPADIEALLSADQKRMCGKHSLWPNHLFRQTLSAARSSEVRVTSTSGELRGIELPDELQTHHAWKLAGVRIDPSAPGCAPQFIRRFGSKPQIRLVFQPVTADESGIRVHDFAAHLVFDYVKTPAKNACAIPDQEAFTAIVKALVELKYQLEAVGVESGNALGVHPGFLTSKFDLTHKLCEFLRIHLQKGRISRVAFMGVQRPEPWILRDPLKSLRRL